jgi:hypothetical protein
MTIWFIWFMGRVIAAFNDREALSSWCFHNRYQYRFAEVWVTEANTGAPPKHSEWVTGIADEHENALRAARPKQTTPAPQVKAKVKTKTKPKKE